MLELYFKENPILKKYREDQLQRREFERQIVSIASGIKEEFNKHKPTLTVKDAEIIMSTMINELLIPVIKNFCAKLEWKGADCPDDPAQWNQARLAGMLTYNSSQDFIHKLIGENDLKNSLAQLKAWEREWGRTSKQIDLLDYLKTKI
jgi:hypothetical protein